MADHSHKQEIKKDRHSSNAKKGVTAKGGAGGKGVWGKGGADDLREDYSIDDNDPNFDDEATEEVVFKKTEVVSPFIAIIQEYLLSGDLDEVEKSLKEVKVNQTQNSQFVKKALTTGLEKQAYERELVSKLLSTLYSKVLHSEHIEDGFKLAISSIDELKLDNPDAVEVLSKFLARAVMDEIVPPVFLKSLGDEFDKEGSSSNSREVVALATALTTERHRSERLEHVWGPGDLTSVKRLKEEASLLIQEFNVNGDFEEADRAVRKLNAPSFHPQLVKQAIRIALQSSETQSDPTNQMRRISSLLAYLSKEGLVSTDHISRGFQLTHSSIKDIQLDIPHADQLLTKFIEIAKSDSYLPSDYHP